MILGLCKQVELQAVLDKIPKKEPSELFGNRGSETEIGVMEPSQSLFSDNTNEENEVG